MSVSEVAGEGDTFCTLGVKHRWNWRGQPEVDSKFPLIVRERHLQNITRFNLNNLTE